MHNLPITINGDYTAPVGVISLEDVAYEWLRYFWDLALMNVTKDVDRNELKAVNLLLPPSAPGVYGKLNPHPVSQRDLDLRLIALAAVGYLAYADGAKHAHLYKEQVDPAKLAEALDRLGGG